MTPDQINIRIAELCGWKEGESRESPFKEIGTIRQWHEPKTNRLTPNVPNYHSSLDACAQFEATLTGFDATTGKSDYGEYITQLQKITNWNRVPCATAPQRCEAFLRVKGK